MPLNFLEITPLHKHNIMIICTLNYVISERLQFYSYPTKIFKSFRLPCLDFTLMSIIGDFKMLFLYLLTCTSWKPWLLRYFYSAFIYILTTLAATLSANETDYLRRIRAFPGSHVSASASQRSTD